jgi:hypothetical protein
MQDISSTADAEWQALSTVEGASRWIQELQAPGSGGFGTTVRGPLSGRH